LRGTPFAGRNHRRCFRRFRLCRDWRDTGNSLGAGISGWGLAVFLGACRDRSRHAAETAARVPPYGRLLGLRGTPFAGRNHRRCFRRFRLCRDWRDTGNSLGAGISGWGLAVFLGACRDRSRHAAETAARVPPYGRLLGLRDCALRRAEPPEVFPPFSAALSFWRRRDFGIGRGRDLSGHVGIAEVLP
jgi:hypothetical protein